MPTLANQCMNYELGMEGFYNTDDEIVLPNITTQAGAYPVKGQVSRPASAFANSSMILKSAVSGEAPPMCWVINDSAAAVVVFAAVGEALNGVTNGSLSIPAGQSGFFLRVGNYTGLQGFSGGANTGWRAAVVP